MEVSESLKCVICDQCLVDGESYIEVGEKGLAGLIKASKERKDGKNVFLAELISVHVHTYCRKTYTRPSSIAAAETKHSTLLCNDTSSTTLRSSQVQFDFQTKCFYCCEVIGKTYFEDEKKKPLEKRRKVYMVRNLDMKDKVQETARNRNDKWGNEVNLRLSNVPDLIAVHAMYHQDCYSSFVAARISKLRKRGRPEEDYISDAVEEISKFIELNDDCQFCMEELMKEITGPTVDERTIKNKLKQKYGESITITETQGRTSVVCFRRTGHRLLNKSWYESREKAEKEERLRVVMTAAAIVLEDIQSMVLETNEYPESDNFFKDVTNCIPETLQEFLDHVILKKKTHDKSSKARRKSISIAHAIVKAVRPRSVISSLQEGLALFLYRKYESKNLLNLLSSLGFCSSYNDAQTLEWSVIQHRNPEIIEGSFCQFIFDNADFNVSTIDGHRTFHSMGGIKTVTPSFNLKSSGKIRKIKTRPTVKEVGRKGLVTLQTYEHPQDKGLNKVVIEEIRVDECKEIGKLKETDFCWLLAKHLSIPQIPEWKAYMIKSTQTRISEKSAVIPLPFVNASPSSYDAIYTTLQLATQQCMTQQTCVVTFDQPLYIKAREIVAAAPTNSPVSKVVVRLGGFHLLMSYLGSIGQIMAGSGLKELLCTIYAPNSIEKMLSGHAYARSIRAHILVHRSIANIIIDQMSISDDKKANVTNLLVDFPINPPPVETISQDENIQELTSSFNHQLDKLSCNGPTAALWVQYFKLVTLMMDFISSERSGNWEDHLRCVSQMIPIFHASGHTLYAKSSHLYLQDMKNLSSVMPKEEFDKFAKEGYFTTRRTNEFWSGVWSDMLIEQTLMRSMKSVGGLTRGRGLTESVLTRWIEATTATHDICESLEQFAGLTFTTTEQHVDFRESRIDRNTSDTEKLSSWLKDHPPFAENNQIMSIATGLIGDESINCHKAFEKGKQCLSKTIGKNFGDIKLARKDKVLPLAAVNCKMKTHTYTTVVDPMVIFQRIAIVKENNADLANCFQYELCTYPMSLFEDCGMRKNAKSSLYDLFSSEESNINLLTSRVVLDGGFLLHRVKWSSDTDFSSVCMTYVNYINKHYGENCTVVFDGYEGVHYQTKIVEQTRRARLKHAIEVKVEENIRVTVEQEDFLSNPKNKKNLISLLSKKLQENGIEVKLSKGDADPLIVNTAIEKSFFNDNVAVVGEDIDLLVLLVGLTPPEKTIHFFKPGKLKAGPKTFSSKQQLPSGLCESILFLHAFSGCDSTSALYNIGKMKCVNVLKTNKHIQDVPAVFNTPNSTHEAVAEAGKRFFLALYGAPQKQNDLNIYRYICFQRSARKLKSNPATLPPTEAAALQHAYRVYYQVQTWLGNFLTPESWGWTKTTSSLEPIQTLKPIAPDHILKLIFCSCVTGCGLKCGCRRVGVKCTVACANCQGVCLNGVMVEDSDYFDECDIVDL